MDPDLTNKTPGPGLSIQSSESFHDEGDQPHAPERYRAVNRSAVLSIVCAAGSLLVVLSWYFSLFPIVALYLAYRGWRQIMRAPEEMAGMGLVRIGAATAVVLWMASALYLHYAEKNAVPMGYKLLTFDMLQPDESKGEKIPQAIKDLDGKFVFIRGYMYPTRKIIGITRFILVPTEGHCNFCTRQLRPTDMVYVKTSGDLSVDFRNYMIGVGGILRVTPEEGDLAGTTYGLEADVIRE
jgi:hypothetical protein